MGHGEKSKVGEGIAKDLYKVLPFGWISTEEVLQIYNGNGLFGSHR